MSLPWWERDYYLFARSHPASVTNKRRISLEWNPIRWMKGVALYQEGNWFVYDYAGYRRREKHLQTKAQYGGLLKASLFGKFFSIYNFFPTTIQITLNNRYYTQLWRSSRKCWGDRIPEWSRNFICHCRSFYGILNKIRQKFNLYHQWNIFSCWNQRLL